MAFFGIKRNRGAGKSDFDENTFVIVGLGNPGKEYENTRHNMGFKAIDALASEYGVDVRKAKFHSLIGQGRIGSKRVILVKPQTYMNNSGIAVREAAMYFGVPSCNVIVIYDDIDLPTGAIRIRKAGGPGTHNGMKSVVQQLGVKEFPRIRIGVGAAGNDEDLVDRVIGKVPVSEQKLLADAASEAASAASDIITLGIDIAMNRHNHTSAGSKAENGDKSSKDGDKSSKDGDKSSKE